MIPLWWTWLNILKSMKSINWMISNCFISSIPNCFDYSSALLLVFFYYHYDYYWFLFGGCFYCEISSSSSIRLGLSKLPYHKRYETPKWKPVVAVHHVFIIIITIIIHFNWKKMKFQCDVRDVRDWWKLKYNWNSGSGGELLWNCQWKANNWIGWVMDGWETPRIGWGCCCQWECCVKLAIVVPHSSLLLEWEWRFWKEKKEMKQKTKWRLRRWWRLMLPAYVPSPYVNSLMTSHHLVSYGHWQFPNFSFVIHRQRCRKTPRIIRYFNWKLVGNCSGTYQ